MVEVTNTFPKKNIAETYEKLIDDRITRLDGLLLGTEEYLTTMTHRGEQARIPEVNEKQSQNILKFVTETFVKIENIKLFLGFLEY